MPSYHLHTSDDDQEIYTGKQVELIVSEGGIHRNSTLHYKTGKLPSFALCHKVYQPHNQTNLYVNFGSHKHHSNKQATTQYDSAVYVEAVLMCA